VPDDKKKPAGERPTSPKADDAQDPDFQFVLQQLLAAYQPILEQELKRAQSPEELAREEKERPPSCEDEIALGNQLLDKFFTEQVALRLLPPEGRQLLGPIDRWRWCFLHIRCCILFGWLVCRGPRTFRAFFYYLYRYWICVRQALGTAPIGGPLTSEEREDLHVLVQATAAAYKPYLTDQLASVEFPLALPDEVVDGKIDCLEGQEQLADVFERLLTLETAPALLGRPAFEKHSREPFFWFCRCWCLCAIRFGCCLARARNLIDVFRCLRFYQRCLRECFRPLRCEITKPTGCTEEEPNPAVGGLTVTVAGTASGAFFDHYTLELRKVEGQDCQDDADWQTGPAVVAYPGGGAVGAAPVNNGVLGWIKTTVLPPGSYEIRLCVYPTQGAARCCFCIQFNLFKKMVWIERVANAPVLTPPGPFAFDAPIANASPGGIVVPVGCCVTVRGTAYVGDCNNRKIKCVDLRYGLGFLPGPGMVGFNPADYFGSLLAPYGPICYTAPDEALKRAPWNEIISRALTTHFVPTTIELFGSTITVYKLQDFCFDSANQLPPCPDAAHHCRSGKYTLLLDVTDTLGNHYYDTQHVWFDNKPIHAEFSGLEGLKRCEDMSLGKFLPPGAPCGIPWPLNVLGIAYDEYIDNADLAYPSDNFDYYSLWITRQGGPTYAVPITLALPPIFGPDPLKGTTRVGDPGTRCEEFIPGCPPPALPGKFAGLLTKLDLRIFDAVCAAALVPPGAPPAGFALERGTCCGYSFQLYAQDKTWNDAGPGWCHRIWTPPWAVCICNDVEQRPTTHVP
jgi:hypothetical protein